MTADPIAVSQAAVHAGDAVLAGVLLYADDIPSVVASLDPQWWWSPPQQEIVRAIVAVRDAGQPIDLVTVTAFLSDHGLAYIDATRALLVVGEVPIRTRIPEHIAALRKLTARCQLLAHFRDSQRDAVAGDMDGAARRLETALADYRKVVG